MYKKRGQLTIFIIFGIIFLTITGVLILLNSSSTKENTYSEESFGTDSIKDHVQSCLSAVSEDAILNNAYSGGYFLLPKESTKDLNDNVPFYFIAGNESIPSNKVIEKELADYIDTMLDLCLNDFNTFKKSGFNLSFEEPITKVKLTPTKIIVNTNMLLTIVKGSVEKTLASFETEINTKDVYEDYLLAKGIVSGQEAGEICVSCFSALALKNNVMINVLPLGNNTYLFDLQDNDYIIDYENYRLRFAVQYETE